MLSLRMFRVINRRGIIHSYKYNKLKGNTLTLLFVTSGFV
jgi:hypothetical protein